MKPNENHPLAGTRILVGRARHQAGSLSASLRSLGASVIEIPFIEIRKPQSYRPLDEALKNIRQLRLAHSHQRQRRRSDVGARPETSSSRAGISSISRLLRSGLQPRRRS